MFYRILAVMRVGGFIITSSVFTQDAKKPKDGAPKVKVEDKYKLKIDVESNFNRNNKHFETVVSGISFGEAAFPDSSVFSATISRINYGIRWLDKSLVQKAKELPQEFSADIKNGIVVIKCSIDTPGFYKVDVVYDPAIQQVNIPDEIAKPLTFSKMFAVGGAKSILSLLESELKFFDNIAKRAKGLIEKMSKDVADVKKWVDNSKGAITELNSILAELDGARGVTFSYASFDIIHVTMTDVLSYVQIFDEAAQKYVRIGEVKGVNIKELTRDFRSTYGDSVDFKYFQNNIKIAGDVYVREYISHILIFVEGEVVKIDGIYEKLLKGAVNKEELVRMSNEFSNSLKDINVACEKLNVGNYKNEYAKYSKVMLDIVAKCDDATKVYLSLDKNAIEKTRMQTDSMFSNVKKIVFVDKEKQEPEKSDDKGNKDNKEGDK